MLGVVLLPQNFKMNTSKQLGKVCHSWQDFDSVCNSSH